MTAMSVTSRTPKRKCNFIQGLKEEQTKLLLRRELLKLFKEHQTRHHQRLLPTTAQHPIRPKGRAVHALLHPLLDPFPGGSRAQCPRLLGPSVRRSARSDASFELASTLGAAAEVARSPDAAHRSDREVDAANSNYDRLCVLSRFLSQSAISANLAPSSANAASPSPHEGHVISPGTHLLRPKVLVRTRTGGSSTTTTTKCAEELDFHSIKCIDGNNS
ncbi:hypothetical protein HPB47_006835 [Ixodes persulcatus]|uniref:Uncharacterized protein n=1 Tax=Ixodes persulcatus TaxID=34615 RepID=A0AC60P974_IXOPE|nr:hypothetical protein HPB47_006835 [Ixodes persulcatus]